MSKFKTEMVFTAINEAAEFVSDSAGQRFRDDLAFQIDNPRTIVKLDSPLEELFYVWWCAYERVNGSYLDSFGGLNLRPHYEAIVDQQRFVIDFAIEPANAKYWPNWTPLGIELDGHEFHERTREQVERRDTRDRILMIAGWQIFHFSYAEFVRDPSGKVAEIMDLAAKATIEAYRATLPAITVG